MAGANSIFYGDKLLTTGNNDTTSDIELIKKERKLPEPIFFIPEVLLICLSTSIDVIPGGLSMLINPFTTLSVVVFILESN